jgi:hypothetical protein
MPYENKMVIELHHRQIEADTLPAIQVHLYYVIDYVNTFYVGRVLKICQDNALFTVTFLHSKGSKIFDWPNRDDIDKVHRSCIFYGPVTLRYRPFHCASTI